MTASPARVYRNRSSARSRTSWSAWTRSAPWLRVSTDSMWTRTRVRSPRSPFSSSSRSLTVMTPPGISVMPASLSSGGDAGGLQGRDDGREVGVADRYPVVVHERALAGDPPGAGVVVGGERGDGAREGLGGVQRPGEPGRGRERQAAAGDVVEAEPDARLRGPRAGPGGRLVPVDDTAVQADRREEQPAVRVARRAPQVRVALGIGPGGAGDAPDQVPGRRGAGVDQDLAAGPGGDDLRALDDPGRHEQARRERR